MRKKEVVHGCNNYNIISHETIPNRWIFDNLNIRTQNILILEVSNEENQEDHVTFGII